MGVLPTGSEVRLDDGQVTDPGGLLTAEELERLEAALAELRDEDGVQLFVVLVDSFDGVPRAEWANDVFDANGLGLDDALLAVAVSDRQYEFVVDESLFERLSEADEARILREDVEPAFSRGEWHIGAIGASEGMRRAIDGDAGAAGGGVVGDPTATVVSVPAGGRGADGEGADGDGSAGAWSWLLGVLLLVGVVFVIRRMVRQRRALLDAAEGRQRPDGDAPHDPIDALSDDELATKGSALLVEVDDAITTSEVDLNVAEVEFGAAVAAPYREALVAAAGEVRRGFEARMRLAEELDGEARRQVLRTVYEHAQRADALLDAQAAAFSELRDRANRAPDIVAALRPQLAAAETRLPQVVATLAELRRVVAPSALGEAADNDEEAAERLRFATAELAAAEQALAAGDVNRAAVSSRGVEEALVQFGTLLDAVDNAAVEIAQARGRLAGEFDDLRRLVAEGDALPSEQADAVATALRSGRTVLDELAARLDDPTLDPLDAAARLDAAEAALTTALGPVRAAQAEAADASRKLTDVTARVAARIQAVDDYITTRRGGIGVEARTELGAARQQLGEAQALAASDPVAALQLARSASSSIESAARWAESDVAGYRQSPYSGPGRGGERDFDGAVLGGILLDNGLRGARGGGYSAHTQGSGGGLGSLLGALFGGGGGSGSTSSRSSSTSSRSSGTRSRSRATSSSRSSGSRSSGRASPGRYGGSRSRRSSGGRF